MEENLHPSEKPALATSIGVELRGDNVLMGFQLTDTGRKIVLAMPEMEASWLAQAIVAVL